MQEFTTVSASSYDPAALATKLTEKASEGWSVAGIVSTGGDVTAFLSRDKSSSTSASSSAASGAGASGSSSGGLGGSGASGSPTSSTSGGYGGGSSGSALTGSGGSGSGGKDYGSSAPGSTASYTTPSSEPPRVTEPAGWGSAPGSSSSGSSSSGSPSSGSSSGMAPIGEQQSYAPAAGVYNPAPAAPAVPAGWYADPAGRFELRYWDGTTWTEHVSRAGQQYTDPPVA